MVSLLTACVLCALLNYETPIVGQSGQLKLIQPTPQHQLVEAKVEPSEEERKIRTFLTRHDSPLKDSARDFVEISRTYKADPFLLVAIAGKESGFGKNQCAGFNAFGYGNPCYGFGSYRESIERVCKTIMGNRAYSTFHKTGKIEDLAPVYNKPQGYEDWVKDVKWFMEKISQEKI